ncbi:MAG: MerR family transcriptional regulator [Rhodobacteraceae bacterium]|nr:MerR family transcriptional regulator [Paracoccaceae bacterium]
MDKSPDAFRTISEVADLLETPAHVLRFWESRFPQIRPVKRAGGRRYYRPADVALLTGIKRLLHDEGLTIRGVQKILREQGVRHVSGLTDGGEDAEAALEAALAANFPDEGDDSPPPVAEVESAQIVALETALRRTPPRPVQQDNLFAGLFDDGAPAAPPEAAAETGAPPEPAQPVDPEEEIFAEVSEAVALALAEDHAADAPAGDIELAGDAAPDDLPADDLPAEDLSSDDQPAVDMPAAAAMLAQDTPSDDSSDTAVHWPEGSLAARIAALPRAALRPYRDELRAVLDRLTALEDRLAAPPV